MTIVRTFCFFYNEKMAGYALNFALQAADRALLSSLKAIDAQMTQQEQDERSFP